MGSHSIDLEYLLFSIILFLYFQNVMTVYLLNKTYLVTRQ